MNTATCTDCGRLNCKHTLHVIKSFVILSEAKNLILSQSNYSINQNLKFILLLDRKSVV